MNAIERPGPDLSVIRADVRELTAYHVPDAAGLIKLDAMENPFPLPPALARELADRLAQVALNRYPPADPAALKQQLARVIGLPDNMALALGNGSDELIHLLIQACAGPDAVVLAPWPGFVMYRTSAVFNRCRFVGVPLEEDFKLDRATLLAAIDECQPSLIFIAYPNNPTGNLFDRATIDAVLDAAPGLVVLDEAYLPFALDTWLPQLSQRSNLLVVRTLSKLGLAGIRLGYLCGDRCWIREIDKLRPPYNVNVLTLAAAGFALDHIAVLDAQAAVLRAERERMLAALRVLKPVFAFDSAANFILLRVAQPAAGADTVFASLKERGILIKNVSRMHPLLAGCLRVTVGTPQENESFLAALSASL